VIGTPLGRCADFFQGARGRTEQSLRAKLLPGFLKSPKEVTLSEGAGVPSADMDTVCERLPVFVSEGVQVVVHDQESPGGEECPERVQPGPTAFCIAAFLT
jgi:hypothetical protein